MNREMRPIEMTWCLAWSQLSLKCIPGAQFIAACSFGSVTWLGTEWKPGPMMTDNTNQCKYIQRPVNLMMMIMMI